MHIKRKAVEGRQSIQTFQNCSQTFVQRPRFSEVLQKFKMGPQNGYCYKQHGSYSEVVFGSGLTEFVIQKLFYISRRPIWDPTTVAVIER